MDEFARQTNMSVGLTCRDRLHMIYVENRLPPEASLLRMDIGLKLPMATTSAGRAYYCAISDKARLVIDDAMAAKFGDDWPEKKAGLDQAMKDYKEHGFCLSIGEWDRNINSAGVPIHLQDGTIMALTCAAPSYLVPAEKLRGSIAHQLAMLAGDIESLGV
jgi:DNA-binding IclR family transcriptional regulator